MSGEEQPQHHEFPEANGPDEDMAAFGSYLGKLMLIPGMVAAMKLAKVATPLKIFSAILITDYFLREQAELAAQRKAEGKDAPSFTDVLKYIVEKPSEEVLEASINVDIGLRLARFDRDNDGRVTPAEFGETMGELVRNGLNALKVSSPALKDMYRDMVESFLTTAAGYVSVEGLGQGAAAALPGVQPHGVGTGLVAGAVTSAAIIEKENREAYFFDGGLYVFKWLKSIFDNDGPGNGAGGSGPPRRRPHANPDAAHYADLVGLADLTVAGVTTKRPPGPRAGAGVGGLHPI